MVVFFISNEYLAASERPTDVWHQMCTIQSYRYIKLEVINTSRKTNNSNSGGKHINCIHIQYQPVECIECISNAHAKNTIQENKSHISFFFSLAVARHFSDANHI